MKVYGITGGAGTGKSEVLKILEEEFSGFIIKSDDVARELTLKGGISYDLIVAYFGTAILGTDGEINRKALADYVFHDEKALHALNDMTHPYVKEKIKSLIMEAAASGKYKFVALESAILLSCGYEDICDEFWYVHTDAAVRRTRMMSTRGYTDEKVDAVMKNQASDAYFIEKCQFVIENNSTLETVRMQLFSKLSD